MNKTYCKYLSIVGVILVIFFAYYLPAFRVDIPIKACLELVFFSFFGALFITLRHSLIFTKLSSKDFKENFLKFYKNDYKIHSEVEEYICLNYIFLRSFLFIIIEALIVVLVIFIIYTIINNLNSFKDLINDNTLEQLFENDFKLLLEFIEANFLFFVAFFKKFTGYSLFAAQTILFLSIVSSLIIWASTYPSSLTNSIKQFEKFLKTNPK